AYLAIALVSFLGFLTVWFSLSYSAIVPAYFLPSPIAVVRALWELLTKRDLLGDVAISFYRVMVGFVLSAVLAIPVGLLVGSFRPFEALIEPVNDFIRYMPVPAFIPLLILWFGIGNRNAIATIFVGTFFQLLLLVADSV